MYFKFESQTDLVIKYICILIFLITISKVQVFDPLSECKRKNTLNGVNLSNFISSPIYPSSLVLFSLMLFLKNLYFC